MVLGTDCLMWTLPLLILLTTVALAVPLGVYMAWIFDGRYRCPGWLRWFEDRCNTGPQTWKQYTFALLLFNVAIFVLGFAILALQPVLPLNPDGKKMLAATTIFSTLSSFLSNTNLQHYSGEVHLSYFSQLFFVCWMQFITPAIGLCALLAMIRGLRGDKDMGNFYVDLWRSVMYLFVPLSFIFAIVLIGTGVPMTLERAAQAQTLDPQAMAAAAGQPAALQTIARGPVAAILAIKQLGTNGGGFFGANCCHPFENPNDWSNLLCCVAIILIPVASLVMFGKMLKKMRHAAVIFGVMFVLSAATIMWAIYHDSMQPNPALLAHPERTYQIPDPAAEGGQRTVVLSAVAGFPVDQSLGNLEGKELRFGTSAGPTWAAITTNTSNGSVNCMHDSLNPLAGLTPMTGM